MYNIYSNKISMMVYIIQKYIYVKIINYTWKEREINARFWRIFGYFLYTSFLKLFVKKTRATVASYNRKSKRFSRVQTKDHIPQRLLNVRVDVEMIENAFLVYQFQLSRRTLYNRRSAEQLLFRLRGTISAAKADRLSVLSGFLREISWIPDMFIRSANCPKTHVCARARSYVR